MNHIIIQFREPSPPIISLLSRLSFVREDSTSKISLGALRLLYLLDTIKPNKFITLSLAWLPITPQPH